MGLELKRDLMGIFIGGNGRTGSDRATASGTGQMASVLGESGETGKCMGLGVFVWPSQLQYSGQWLDHKRNGFGFEMHQQEDNSATYKGEWKKGKRHGLGVRIRSCGSTYKGAFAGGKRNKKQNNSITEDKLSDVLLSVEHFDTEAQSELQNGRHCFERIAEHLPPASRLR